MSDIDKAYSAGWEYWQKNRPEHALHAGLAFHCRTCGWRDRLMFAWFDGFFDAKVRSARVDGWSGQ